MSTDSIIILISVLGVGAVSLSGVSLLVLREGLLKRCMLLLIGFSAGALLGDVFLHILPELVEEAAISQWTWFAILGGIIVSFILEKFIHWHHCHSVECDEHVHPIGLMSIIGDLLHNALDGMLIGGSFLVSTEVGIATTVAVLLHEIPQEISDVGILLYSGYSKKKAILFNALTGVASILGAIVILLLESAVPDSSIGYLLPFAAGNFLYIAASDLIPELHKETDTRKSMLQLVSIIAGIGFMFLLTMMG